MYARLVAGGVDVSAADLQREKHHIPVHGPLSYIVQRVDRKDDRGDGSSRTPWPSTKTRLFHADASKPFKTIVGRPSNQLSRICTSEFAGR